MSDSHLISLQPGTVIGGKYELVKCLGSGSMGMVYACRNRALQGQMVAAKVLFNEVAADTTAAARFKNEVLASYEVIHPNVVRAYEYINDGDLVAYTMEYVGGGDLADKMSRAEAMSVADFIRIVSQMAAGVQAIHDAGIVHRDLKPENILLTTDGNVKIADFGIARKRNGPKLTEHGGVVGTIEYVAPEYMLRSQVDWRSDIYALGVLAYEMIAGEPPFRGDSAYASISKRLQTDPEPPSKHRSDCPKEIDAIILKALARDPENRYQSAMELYQDLQDAAKTLRLEGGVGSNVLMPSQNSQGGARYLGPTLDTGGASDSATERPKSTQFLTSDDSIQMVGGGAELESGWSAKDIGNRSESGASHNVLIGRKEERDDDTEVLTAAYVDYSIIASGADRVVKPSALEPMLGSISESMMLERELRSDLRERRGKPYVATEFPVNLVEQSNQRLRLLDMLTLILAALVGVGCGFVLLRIFAPSVLERLKLIGIG